MEFDVYARITSVHSDSSGNLDHYREIAPRVWSGTMAQPGCLGGVVLADPVSGTVHEMTFWRDAENLIASKGSSQVVAASTAGLVGADPSQTVVQILAVIGLDLEAVVAAANRRGEKWPVLCSDE